MGKFGQDGYQRYINALTEDRLKKLEEKVFKLGRTPTNLSQQMLLLEELGMLEPLKELDLSNQKLASLLSLILNADKENIRKDLSLINLKDSKLKTSTNYAFLIKSFEEVGLENQRQNAEKEYNRIKNREDKLK